MLKLIGIKIATKHLIIVIRKNERIDESKWIILKCCVLFEYQNGAH